MRIGVDARFLGASNSGLARYSDHLLQALARIDTHNEYIVYVHASLRRRLRLGENFRVVPMRGSPLSLASMTRLAQALEHERVDFVHVHFPLAPLGVECPVLLTVHDILPFQREPRDLGPTFNLWRGLMTHLLYPLSLRKASWIICVSNATRASLSQIFPDAFHKSIVLHSAVQAPAGGGDLDPTIRERIRERLQLPRRYLLYSGSTRMEKNLDAALRAWARLRRDQPGYGDLDFVFELNGEARRLPLVRQTARDLGVERGLRIVRDATEEERRLLFEEARALVMLSRSEGFGFPLLEAQQCGIPVLAADAGALPEVGGEEGALYVDPDNEDQIAEMLARLVNDEALRAYLIDNGRRNAERFNWDATVQQLVRIYDLLFWPRNLIEPPEARHPFRKALQWLRL